MSGPGWQSPLWRCLRSGSVHRAAPSTLGSALLAYDGVVQTDRRRDLLIADLFGNGADGTADNTLGTGEHIVSITLGTPLPRERAVYRRAISRASAEWPLVEVVVRVVVDNAQFHFVRVAVGGIAPVPLRLKRVENALQSRRVDGATIEEAAGLAIEGARPLPQTGYKLHLLRAQITDVLAHVTALEDA